MTHDVGIRPVGGLGNQLFIYATGLDLACKTGATLRIHTDWYATNHDRQLELQSFRYTGALDALPMPFDRQFRSRTLPPRVRSYVARRSGVNLHIEETHAYTPIPESLSSSLELRGYFQSWRYFADISVELATQMNDLANPSSSVTRQLETLQELGDWIALHVRCGDFLDPALLGLHGKTNRDYYERALTLLEALRSPMPLVVFSDEPDCARRLLSGLRPDMHFLDLDPEIRPMDWIYILSHAQSVVTANSSYSWWVAWLAEQRGAWPIICPRPWFADTSIPEQDLLPLTWLTVGREYR